MTWETPELVEINMSAEIGAYQEDFEEREDAPLFLSQRDPEPASLEHG